MCGIAGWIDHSQYMSERIDLLNRMSETLDRRGPDENGLYINRGAALMHRRLVELTVKTANNRCLFVTRTRPMSLSITANFITQPSFVRS